ncbi:MAG: disulfide isomerase [Burkholderiales bacterium RIFOXYC12_FULL_65_23]|uniref:DsbC family protein n=1 Tax=Malikia spinosa TaxID=86180 RepID=UPI0008BE48C5|nr:DsbC family protein [Malikia spinosa]OGB71897.1 MAG: disulfide isomerase [Burkholderiales bacterium RIFOXYC12_FULL_65_23]
MNLIRLTIRTLLAATLVTQALGASAQEAAIRKNLAERLPNLPRIDEVSKTQMPGLYEVRVNQSDILYTDAEGNYLLQGELIDTRTRSNLTEERVSKLSAVDFKALPFKDAFTIVRGNGKRRIAIFEDPNCGYCKRFEKDLAKIDNVTVHVFLYPVLGPDSQAKSQAIWCAKDKAKAFEDWMLRNIAPPPASCDSSAIQRNLALGKQHRITGTPTSFLPDGTRLPGAVPLEKIEQALANSK